MPDPAVIVTAMIVSVTISAVLTVVTGWFGRLGWPSLNKAGYILSIGFGFFFGCWVLGTQPRWHPREDLERLLVVVLPAVMGIELLTALVRAPVWLIWPLRVTLLVGTARVLLHGTSYITDLTGPGTSEWSPLLAWLIFGSAAAVEGAVWAAVSQLTRRASDSSVSICLAITSAGAAVTVMLSGYAKGGQIGFPLAAALIGTTTLTLFRRLATPGIDALGVPLVGLFSLLFIGHFFGALSLGHAVALLCAPLVGWLPEFPRLRHLPSWIRDLTRVALVGAVVLSVIVRAQVKFNDDFRSSTSNVHESLEHPAGLELRKQDSECPQPGFSRNWQPS